ncbi:hypothetical protein ACOXXX_00635 [Thalassococcus sp. BH17M4-6]|uniref:hypothetical protein n=1 Tax=Thalassococcus sp. BH17M4-6 TaxID=3413148 RepID=UPI003BD940F6
MNRFLTVAALCMSTAAIPAFAAPVTALDTPAMSQFTGQAELLLIKNDKANKGKKPKKLLKKGGKGAEKRGKSDAPGQNRAAAPKAAKPDNNGKGNGQAAAKPTQAAPAKSQTANAPAGQIDPTDPQRTRVEQARAALLDSLDTARAPEGRDMAPLVGVATLGLLGSDVVVGDLPEDELLTYRNCPPGLAKKDPPCVPPGLAKKGVSYDEWTGYDSDDYDALLEERRRVYYGDSDWERDTFPDDTAFLLRSDDIARLYGLDPAPEGQRYALIDGLPVLLDAADYGTLARINDLARVPDTEDSLLVSPTAALGQEELRRLYRLPEAGDGYNYAVLNGDVVRLDNDSYELLQLIRVTRAIL